MLVAQHPSPEGGLHGRDGGGRPRCSGPDLGGDASRLRATGRRRPSPGWSAEGPIVPLGTQAPARRRQRRRPDLPYTCWPRASTATRRWRERRPKWREACGFRFDGRRTDRRRRAALGRADGGNARPEEGLPAGRRIPHRRVYGARGDRRGECRVARGARAARGRAGGAAASGDACRARMAPRRGPRGRHRRGGAGVGDRGGRACFASRTTAPPHSSHSRRLLGIRPRWAPVSRSMVRTSSPRCIEPGGPPAWTTGRMQPVRSPPWRMCSGVRSAVATPIVVAGRLWGTMIAATSKSKPLPADIKLRIREFTELVATASQTPSRARRSVSWPKSRLRAAGRDARRPGCPVA